MSRFRSAPTLHNLFEWFNVRDYGAMGDGSHDDSVAIQAAITACFNAGGGTIYFPEGVYNLDGKLSSNNCLLDIPFNASTTSEPITIELCGAYPPPTAYPEGNSMPVPTKGAILLASTTPAGSYPSVIGVDGSSFSNILFVVRNLTVRCSNNPGYRAINAYMAANCIIENVVCDVNAAITTSLTLPSNAESCALLLPATNNYGLVRVTNFYAIGYYTGIQYQEHCVMDNIFIQCCYRAFQPTATYHSNYMKRILAQWCPYVFYPTGTSYTLVDYLDIEDSTNATWTPIDHIYDPSNYLYATITAHRVQQGGTIETATLTVNGATNCKITIL